MTGRKNKEAQLSRNGLVILFINEGYCSIQFETSLLDKKVNHQQIVLRANATKLL